MEQFADQVYYMVRNSDKLTMGIETYCVCKQLALNRHLRHTFHTRIFIQMLYIAVYWYYVCGVHNVPFRLFVASIMFPSVCLWRPLCYLPSVCCVHNVPFRLFLVVLFIFVCVFHFVTVLVSLVYTIFLWTSLQCVLPSLRWRTTSAGVCPYGTSTTPSSLSSATSWLTAW